MGIKILGWKCSASVYLYDIPNVKRLEIQLLSIPVVLESW